MKTTLILLFIFVISLLGKERKEIIPKKNSLYEVTIIEKRDTVNNGKDIKILFSKIQHWKFLTTYPKELGGFRATEIYKTGNPDTIYGKRKINHLSLTKDLIKTSFKSYSYDKKSNYWKVESGEKKNILDHYGLFGFSFFIFLLVSLVFIKVFKYRQKSFLNFYKSKSHFLFYQFLIMVLPGIILYRSYIANGDLQFYFILLIGGLLLEFLMFGSNEDIEDFSSLISFVNVLSLVSLFIIFIIMGPSGRECSKNETYSLNYLLELFSFFLGSWIVMAVGLLLRKKIPTLDKHGREIPALKTVED